jgi:hypothetical protein
VICNIEVSLIGLAVRPPETAIRMALHAEDPVANYHNSYHLPICTAQYRGNYSRTGQTISAITQNNFPDILLMVFPLRYSKQTKGK